MKNNMNIKFSGKATYQIKIQGKLNKSRSTMLGSMKIETVERSDKKYTTTLTGIISDQSALSGILNSIYEMHFSVISVKCLDTNNDSNNNHIK